MQAQATAHSPSPNTARLRPGDLNSPATAHYGVSLPPVRASEVPSRAFAYRAVSATFTVLAVVVVLVVVACFVVTLDMSVNASGVVEPARVWTVRPSQAGVVSNIAVHEGELVHAGQLVAQLDAFSADADVRQQALQVAATEADYERAKASAPLDAEEQANQIVEAQTKLMRARANLRLRLMEFSLKANVDSVLREYAPGRSVNVDLALADVHSAEAALRTAEIGTERARLDSVDLARRRLELERLQTTLAATRGQRGRLNLVSPIDGVVLTQDPHELEGSAVAAGGQVVEIADLRNWKIQLLVAERDIHDVHPGQRAVVDMTALSDINGRQLHGRVAAVAAQGEGASGGRQLSQSTFGGVAMYRVTVDLDSEDLNGSGVGYLRRGYTVRAKLITRSGRIADLIVAYLADRVRRFR